MFRNVIHITLFRKEEQHNDFPATEMLVSGLNFFFFLACFLQACAATEQKELLEELAESTVAPTG